MQVTETKNEGLNREYTLAIKAADFETTVTNRLEQLAKTVNIPGFRKGKVPVSLLRKKYGQNVMGEALDQAVNEAVQKVMNDNELRPAMQPKIEIVKFEEGKDIECTLAVEVMPKIEISDFSKISVVRPVTETDEGEVTKTLERMAEAYKTAQPIAKARKSKSGDVLVIDFVGSVDGKEFSGGKAEDYSLELGSNSFIPGFEDQLVGVNAGDDVEVKVSFPAEYAAKELAGKDAVFACKVKEIQESKPSAIDDELAKKAGMSNLDTLKTAIREQHSQGFTEISRQKAKRALLDALHDAYTFELPQGLVDAEFDSIQKAFEQAKEAGQDVEDLDDAERETEFRDIANRRVKLGLLFAEVGRTNNIEVNQDDIQKAVMREAQNYPGQEQMVFKYYQENPQAMQQLSGPVYEEKIVDFILELAKVTEKTVTVEELMAEDEDDKPKKKAGAKKTQAKKATAKADDKPAAKKAPAKKAAAKKAAAKKAD
jgi:trigger factor